MTQPHTICIGAQAIRWGSGGRGNLVIDLPIDDDVQEVLRDEPTGAAVLVRDSSERILATGGCQFLHRDIYGDSSQWLLRLEVHTTTIEAMEEGTRIYSGPQQGRGQGK